MVFEFLINAGIATSFLLHTMVLGSAILGCFSVFTPGCGYENNSYLKLFFSLSIGISINILVLMLLGTLGYLNSFFVGLLGAVSFLIALYPIRFDFSIFRKMSISGAIGIGLLFCLTLAFSWHAPGYWDDTSFHLPLARYYLEHEAIVLQEYLRFPLFPQNMNMLIVLGLMFGDTLTAQIFATLPWFVIGMGLMGICKWLMGSSIIGILIAIFLVKFVIAFKVGFGYAYVDVGLAMFCWSATLALVLWYGCQKENSPNNFAWILIAGFLAGSAAGTKLFGGVFAFILYLSILLIIRNLRAGILFSILVLASGVWWYLRSYLISGDPFHPVMAKYFGYFLWNEQDLLSQVSEQNAQGSEKNPLYIFSVLKNVGAQLWILVFAGLFLKGLPGIIRLMQAVFITYFIFWFFVTQVERYLAPVVVLGTFLAFYTLYILFNLISKKISWLGPNKKRSMLFNVVILLLCLSVGIKEMRRGIMKWDEHLQSTQGYELFSKASELRVQYGSRLVQMGFENAAYFFTGIAIGDWFGVARYSKMISCDDGICLPLGELEMKELLDGFNSKMLAVSFERYPLFKPENYSTQFEVVLQNSQGVLLVLKDRLDSPMMKRVE